MPEILRKVATQITTIKAGGSLGTLPAVGIGLYRRNSSPIEWPASMDYDSNRLLH
jgi:hypothetical protein